MSEANGALPEGWALTRIGEVCDVNPRRNGTDTPEDMLPVSFVPMAAVDAETGTIQGAEDRTFSEVRKGYTTFRDDDVIFARITPCMENGKSAVARGLTNGLGFGSTEFHVLRPSDAVLPEYVYHFVRQETFRRAAAEHMTGAVGQARVPADYVKAAAIPLPPLEEQRRIVEAAETLLAGVTAVRERLERVPAILRRFRQSVLAAACDGRLTADWRAAHPDVEPASALLDRIAAERRARLGRKYRAPVTPDSTDLPDLPESWKWATVEAITENHDGARVPVKASDRAKMQGEYPYYGASGIIDHVDDFLFDGSYLLISEDGANLLARNTPIAFQAHGQFWVNNHAHIVRTEGGIPLGYLEHYLNGFDLQYIVTGSAQPKLTQAAMNRIPVPVPPLEEQVEIVRRADALMALADKVEARVEAARRHAERTAQAVLAKAFRGELVPTEAELARAEGRDFESGADLLARLQPPARTARRRGRLRKSSADSGQLSFHVISADDPEVSGLFNP